MRSSNLEDSVVVYRIFYNSTRTACIITADIGAVEFLMPSFQAPTVSPLIREFARTDLRPFTRTLKPAEMWLLPCHVQFLGLRVVLSVWPA